MGRRDLCQCVRKEEERKREPLLWLKEAQGRIKAYYLKEKWNSVKEGSEKNGCVCNVCNEWVLVYQKWMVHRFPLHVPPYFSMSPRFAYCFYPASYIYLQSLSVKLKKCRILLFYFQSSFWFFFLGLGSHWSSFFQDHKFKTKCWIFV